VKVRRVVTGFDENGKSVFASDSEVDGLTVGMFPGWEFHPLWGGDETPTFPDDGAHPAIDQYFPGVDGFRFSFSTIPPEGVQPPSPDLDPAEAEAEVEEKLPGLMSHMEADDPGMHTTDTIDFEVILRGEVILELDDGVEVRLKPGDTVVQNGTRHRWKNAGTEPVLMAVFMVGANRAGS
jgi:mannose-6-phosphate isomerase-like protein (cupin superfamily)